MKKLLLLLLLALFSCKENKDKLINLQKNQLLNALNKAEYDSIRYDMLCKDYLSLQGDSVEMQFKIDSLEYIYTGKHNSYYKRLQWEKTTKKVQQYQSEINKLKREIDSMINNF